MPMTILAAMDGHAGGREALAFAADLAGRAGARLVAAHVYAPDLVGYAAGIDVSPAAEEDRERCEFERQVANVSPPADVMIVAGNVRSEGVAEAARRSDAAFVVVGSSRRGRLARVLGRDLVAALLRSTPCPVVVVPHGGSELPDAPRIVAGWDGSADSAAALGRARELHDALGGTVTLFHALAPLLPAVYGEMILDVDEWQRELVKQEQDCRDRMADVAREAGLDAAVEIGHLSAPLALEQRSAVADLLVVGPHGRRGFGRLLGSATRVLLTRSACPLVVVPASPRG